MKMTPEPVVFKGNDIFSPHNKWLDDIAPPKHADPKTEKVLQCFHKIYQDGKRKTMTPRQLAVDAFLNSPAWEPGYGLVGDEQASGVPDITPIQPTGSYLDKKPTPHV
jgi:hypothetical protein